MPRNWAKGEIKTGAKANVNSNRPRLLNVAASSLTVGLMQGQMGYLQQRGFDVMVASPPGKQLEKAGRIEGVATVELAMARDIAPVRDLVSFWRLCRIMRTLRPTVTNVGTPKAGLLGGFAAWVNRVPCRFYTLRGLRFETTKGLRRRLLIYAERLACRFAHRVICVSKSVRETAIALGLTTPEKAIVFGSGSSNGVDASRFAPTPDVMKRAAELRRELGIPLQAPVIGFVGRVTRDKGIPELVEAFQQLREQFPDLRLLLVGHFEREDPIAADVRKFLETDPYVILDQDSPAPARLHREDVNAQQRSEDWSIDDMVPYYAIIDIVVLPSHREGLPNVVLEAQAAGKPVVAARSTGIVDAVVDGRTGLLFPIGDSAALSNAVARLLTDKVLAKRLAVAGQERVRREFRPEQVWEALYREYLDLLRLRGLSLPEIPSSYSRFVSPFETARSCGSTEAA